jgi:hypothetical protein
MVSNRKQDWDWQGRSPILISHQVHALSEEDMERLIRWLQEAADAESERIAFK